MLFVFLTFLAAGVSLIYATNRHQLTLQTPLPHQFKYLGFIFLVISAVCSAFIFTGAAILFLWLMLFMLALMLLPISSFLLRKK